MSLFRPFLLKKDITCISVDMLQELGIRVLLLDVDNTLTAHNSRHLSAEVEQWLRAVQAAGIKPVIVSNGKPQRVQPFAERVGLYFIANAAKPLPFGFRRAAKRLGASGRQCLVIGDQIFTDVLGGKLAGIRVAQVLPLDTASDTGFIRFKRKLEKVIMKRWEVDE